MRGGVLASLQTWTQEPVRGETRAWCQPGSGVSTSQPRVEVSASVEAHAGHLAVDRAQLGGGEGGDQGPGAVLRHGVERGDRPALRGHRAHQPCRRRRRGRAGASRSRSEPQRKRPSGRKRKSWPRLIQVRQCLGEQGDAGAVGGAGSAGGRAGSGRGSARWMATASPSRRPVDPRQVGRLAVAGPHPGGLAGGDVGDADPHLRVVAAGLGVLLQDDLRVERRVVRAAE